MDKKGNEITENRRRGKNRRQKRKTKKEKIRDKKNRDNGGLADQQSIWKDRLNRAERKKHKGDAIFYFLFF